MAVAPPELQRGPQESVVVDETPPPPGPKPPDMPLNLATLRYGVGILDQDSGRMLRLPVVSATQEQQKEEVAMRVQATIPDVISNRGPLWEMCKMGTPAFLLAGGEQMYEVMRGTIVEVGERTSQSGSFPITIYDPIYNGLRDHRDIIFPAGATITDVLNAYAQASGFELGEIHDAGTKLPTLVMRQKSVVEGIGEALKLLVSRGGQQLVLRTKMGKLECVLPGTNNAVYWLRAGETAISSGVRGSIAELVTRVLVLGHGNDDQALAVRAEREGLTSYVGAQHIEYAEETDSDAMVGLTADSIMAEKGFPVWEFSHTSWLIPWLYKWDRVRITDSIMDGYFLVTGISADYAQRTMNLSLMTQEDLDRQTANIVLTTAVELLRAEAQKVASTAKDAEGVVIKHALPGTAWTSGGTHGGHPAVDIFAKLEEPVLAPVAGSMKALQASLGGNCGILTGDDGKFYYFAHCSKAMSSGKVKAGQTIGHVGQSGNAAGTAPHVHFAIGTSGGVFGELNGSGDITGGEEYWVMAA